MTAPNAFRSLAPDHRPTPRTPYEHGLRAMLDALFEAYPVWATHIGYHAFDDRWPDLTEAGRQARMAMLGEQRAAMEAFTDGDLSPDERIDRTIAIEAIEAFLFEEEQLREPAWDPLSYVYLLGSGFFSLLAREFAPFAHRGAAFLARVRQMPAVLDAARENLGSPSARPVSRLHTETALEQLSGIDELIEQAIEEAKRRRDAESDDAAAALSQELEAAGPVARAALEAFRRHLEEDVLPRSEGEGRLGAQLFQEKLRHTLASDLSHEELLSRARHDHDVVRAEMVRLARDLWPTWVPDERPPDAASAGSDEAADDEAVARVLHAIGQEHRRPEELLDHCQAEVGRIEGFVAERQLIGLPDEPLQVTWTPVFMRAYGGAFLDSPGPLDKGQASYFWITPPGDDWPPERTESYLREDNDRMLRLLCIHEGIPGHYLQLNWANRSPSLTRSVFASGMFAEGWAVYVTQVMMDVGYGADDPALMLVHWKFYLRAVDNAIIDVLIHTAGMNEQDAMDLMVRGGWQEEQEARAKWLRARLTSTQLSTYYLGSLEMWDLELAARRRAAALAGAGEDAVPQPPLAGGFGDTPGFQRRAHLEAVISHGMPAIKWVRRIVLADGTAAG